MSFFIMYSLLGNKWGNFWEKPVDFLVFFQNLETSTFVFIEHI